jgi:hypothetical protein
MKLPAHSPQILSIAVLLTGLLAAAGCGTGATPRDLMMEEAIRQPVERPVAMRGESAFLEGKVAALVTVTRGFDRGDRSGPGGRGKKLNPDDNIYDDQRRKRRDDVGAFTEVYNIGGYGDSEEDQKEAMQDYIRQARARRAAGSPMPPVTLRVLFENKGTEPMISQLGVTSDEIPLKLAVRTGGKREQQVVVVKNVIAASLRKEFENAQK